MIGQAWHSGGNKTIVCVDSYQKGVLTGRICSPYQQIDSFESLSQFLIKMEALLDERNMPQSYTETRTFSPLPDTLDDQLPPARVRKGIKATFEIQVIFRQHTSWQGIVAWLDKKQEQSFRSVLELVMLLDSALRSREGSGAA